MVTFEFENVPTSTVEFLAGARRRSSGARALALTQDRLTEKTFLRDLGHKVAPFVGVDDAGALVRAGRRARPPPRSSRPGGSGYDGKGQSLIREGSNVAAVHRTLGSHADDPRGLRRLRARSLGGRGARGLEGEISDLRPLRERARAPHPGLHSRAGARVGAETAAEAKRIGASVLEALDYVGVLAVEMFVTRDHRGREALVVNEIAPRVHNSGHWTLEGAQTSQFEQHIRAIAGWPLGSTTRRGRVEMHNLIGEDAEDWRDILAQPDLGLHLYGKREIRPGRKMGHVTRVFPEAPNSG